MRLYQETKASNYTVVLSIAYAAMASSKKNRLSNATHLYYSPMRLKWALNDFSDFWGNCEVKISNQVILGLYT